MVLTERGVPVARLVAVEAADVLERLEREGVLTPAAAARPRAQDTVRVRAHAQVSDLVTDLRR